MDTLPPDPFADAPQTVAGDEGKPRHAYVSGLDQVDEAEEEPRTLRQTRSSPLLRSSRPFEFRPTADVFIPNRPAEAVPDNSNKATKIASDTDQVQPPVEGFNPYAFGATNLPMYYHMYPVPVGPGAFYDFRSFRKPRSPKKKNNRYLPRRDRKAVSDETAPSPTKSESVDDNISIKELKPEEKGPIQSSSQPSSLADSQRSCTEQLRESVGSPTDGPSFEPFASQLDAIARQAALRKEKQKSVGRASRRIDWTGVRNVHYSPANVQPMTDVNAPRGYGVCDSWFNPQLAQGGPSQTNTLRHHRFRYAPAGVPLESSAPFPDPVAPSGPARHGVSSSAPTHAASQGTGCGQMMIETAAEWGGRACNKCDPDH